MSARPTTMAARTSPPPTNGALSNGMVRSLAAEGVYDDPMSRVLGLDEKTSGLAAWFGYASGSTLLAVALMALISVIAWVHRAHVGPEAPVEEIEITKEEAPPPPPPPVQAEPETKPEPAPPPPHAREAPPPPPAPAQAAKVLTQEPDPNEPIDLTGNTIVQGNADSYAGGFTTANGSNAGAVHTLPGPAGVPGGTGAPTAAPAAAGPDRSRRLKLGDEGDWRNCPFPPEAETEQVDEARVTLRIEVRADGTPAAVTVVNESSPGFGREAKRCAMRMRWPPALDRAGNPIADQSSLVVHFSR